jgi:hypothetical protein
MIHNTEHISFAHGVRRRLVHGNRLYIRKKTRADLMELWVALNFARHAPTVVQRDPELKNSKPRLQVADKDTAAHPTVCELREVGDEKVFVGMELCMMRSQPLEQQILLQSNQIEDTGINNMSAHPRLRCTKINGSSKQGYLR